MTLRLVVIRWFDKQMVASKQKIIKNLEPQNLSASVSFRLP